MPVDICWDDIVEGMEISPRKKIATTQTLVRWAGASGDFNPLHYDAVFAASVAAGKPIVHGALKRQWLIQLITDWMGNNGFLKKFSCQYKAMDFPRNMLTMTDPLDGETWEVSGRITRKYIEGNDHLVDCEVRLVNGQGEITTTGKATVIFPARIN